MINRKIIITGMVVGTALLVGLAITLVSLRRPAPSPPTPIVTPSETPKSFPTEQKITEQLSRELAEKYFTYTDPSSADYVGAVRPYVTDELFAELVKANERGHGAPAIRSSVVSTEVESINETSAEIIVELETAESGQQYKQRIEIRWTKSGDGWLASDISLFDSTRPEDL